MLRTEEQLLAEVKAAEDICRAYYRAAYGWLLRLMYLPDGTTKQDEAYIRVAAKVQEWGEKYKAMRSVRTVARRKLRQYKESVCGT